MRPGPLIPFFLMVPVPFGTAAGATALVFAAIGALKSRWSPHAWWRSALETVVVGGAAAGVAYAIGAWLRDLAG